MSATCTIDGIGPLPVLQPSSVAELGEIVRRAAAEKQALYPLGGRTMLDYGLPPARPGWGIDLGSLTQIIDYPARDMTITVQAGITLAKLQELLATENQRLPIDVPHPDRATLGGVLATNTSGPHRLGCGTLRDYVIGISVVNDLGQEVKAGGRVVKNVAGYDLCKLHIGALGTLGIITQVTLKLRPRPEEFALVALAAETEQIDTLLDHLHRSRTRPVCLELLNRAAVRQAGIPACEAAWLIVAGFEGNLDAVGWQLQQLLRELPRNSHVGLDAQLGQAAEPLWRALSAFPARPEARLIFKANMLPQAVSDFCRRAEALPEKPLLQAHAGNGIVLGQVDGDLTLERAQVLLKALRDLAVAAKGNLIVRRCPVEWKKALPLWGEPRGDLWLMRTVKDKLDPHGLFNAGRFVV